MAVRPSEVLNVTEPDLHTVADLVRALVDGAWVNLVPDIDPELAPPPRGALAAIFSARGPMLPLVTITAPETPGGPLSVGIEHGAGPRALDRLADADHALPAGWRRVADHPRRGLVLTVPGDADPDEVVDWLVHAAHVLCPIPLPPGWLAQSYRP